MKNTQLINKIAKLRSKGKVTLIGIDGIGGSGKTTLASEIKKEISNVTIIQMDDFYSPNIQKADIERVKAEVLLPLSNNKSVKYKIYDWKRNRYIDSKIVKPEGIVIIEGVYAIHPLLKDFYDFKIFIDCTPSVGFKRGSKRDKLKDGIDNTDKWLNIWMPEEMKYIETEKPLSYANYVLKSN